jgi:hypothetical protein
MIAVAVAGLVLTGSLMGAAQAEVQELEPTDSTGLPNKIWKRGLAIAPVPLNLSGKNRKRAGEGSYIVNAHGCLDCHTSPAYALGGNPFRGENEVINTEGYLAGGVQFGPFVSANLTPDPQSGLPAGLSLEQFIEVMRTGRDFKNRHPFISPLLQVMPWPVYAKMTDDDLRAIYEYLSAIPSVAPAP